MRWLRRGGRRESYRDFGAEAEHGGPGNPTAMRTALILAAVLTVACAHRVPDPATVLERGRVAGLRAKWQSQERARQAFLECSAGLGAKCEAEIEAYQKAVSVAVPSLP